VGGGWWCEEYIFKSVNCGDYDDIVGVLVLLILLLLWFIMEVKSCGDDTVSIMLLALLLLWIVVNIFM